MSAKRIAPKDPPMEFIARQNGNKSKQPRFNKVEPGRFFSSILRFTTTDIQNEPAWGDRTRDAWLRRIWPKEPYLAGVINSVVAIDKNRGWTLTGGRNQVRRFLNVFHNQFYYAPDLVGWRMAFGGSSQAYWSSDLGSVTEIGRNGQDGPLDSLYFLDPAACRLTGNLEAPLAYTPSNGGSEQIWQASDYFRVVSMPSTDESKYGLGLCAVSRCIELAKIMVGIYQYDNEMLLNQAPRGLMLLKGITEDQWIDALAAREARLKGDNKTAYGGVEVLTAVDPGVELEAQLVALSSLPAEFDQKTFTDLLMYGYALAFGYDPREFWPVSSGALGTATETEAQHRKAGAKGGLDFPLGFAERLQEIIPPTLAFEFEERDLDGELADAEVESAKVKVVTDMYTAGIQQAVPLISQQQAQTLLAEKGIIPQEWTVEEEDVTATDTEEDEVGRALQNERIQRAIWKYPYEPIVRYKFSIKGGRECHEFKTIRQPSPVKRTFYSFASKIVKRQGGIDSELEDYQQQINDLAQDANDGQIDSDEFEKQLEALTIAILILSLLRGTEGTNEAEQQLETAALNLLADSTDEEALAVLMDNELLQAAFTQTGYDALVEDVNGSLSSTLTQDIYAGKYADNPDGLLSRLAMWGITALGLYTLGRLLANPLQHFQWRLGGTVEHCGDCARLHNQVHTGEQWAASGWRPQGRNLECTGRHCECGVYPVDLPVSGDF